MTRMMVYGLLALGLTVSCTGLDDDVARAPEGSPFHLGGSEDDEADSGTTSTGPAEDPDDPADVWQDDNTRTASPDAGNQGAGGTSGQPSRDAGSGGNSSGRTDSGSGSTPDPDDPPSSPPPAGSSGQIKTVDFSTSYIYSLDRLRAGAISMFTTHPEGVKDSAAFSGTYESKTFPTTANGIAVAAYHLAASAGSAATITISQGPDITRPPPEWQAVDVIFKSDVIAKGKIAVGVTNDAKVMVFYTRHTSVASACVLAIAFGTVEVTVAENTTKSEGGALSLRGSNITLYKPSQTPVGNITSALPAAFPACR